MSQKNVEVRLFMHYDRESKCGGYGIVLLSGGHMKQHQSDCYTDSDIRRIEIKAVTKALEICKPGNVISVYSYSEWLINNITVYLPAWYKITAKAEQYQKMRDGFHAPYADLWDLFFKQLERHSLSVFKYKVIPANCPDKTNALAYRLCRSAKNSEVKKVCTNTN